MATFIHHATLRKTSIIALSLAMCLVTAGGYAADNAPYVGRIPLDAIVVDETGRLAPLMAWMDRPVVLHMGRFQGLPSCGLSRNATFAALTRSGLVPGRDYKLLALSTDPMEGMNQASEAMRTDRVTLPWSKADVGPHYLTGAAGEILSVMVAIAFPAMAPLEGDPRHQPNGIVVLTRDGKVSALDPEPAALPIALQTAIAGKIMPVSQSAEWVCNRATAPDPAVAPSSGHALILALFVAITGLATLLIIRRRRLFFTRNA